MQKYNKYLLILILLLAVFSLLNTSASATQYIKFIITVNPNGEIDRSGNGLYFILFNNNERELINATDNRTFTDFICYNGVNATWYHRRTDPVNPTFFIWEQAGIINTNIYISPDNKELMVTFNVDDKSVFLNQYITQDNFNAHIVTTDNTSRYKFDTLGQGPDMMNNSINTIHVNKRSGVIPPTGPFYPSDPIDDIVKFDNLNKDFPYPNFDIITFEVRIN
ncbi:MAG: hypothetical protein ABIH00_05090 [Armatimonadota bacterium]